ncbi:arsenosugar biosynthesis radical SAM (seleno)protein ArsS [Rhodoferax sp.]|uniref:arsenosugar biosynthesis radical SAM (seleno)protein ArsS n=1 Tax=Rhodoferax sp. TaxID=50421 RepID=UPI0026039CDB|nr:arsenosugar biosynthesis radical SAM (seleno)protein ArsS [Rhodoferax sp.]MDD2926972.1 arsenosugar biosynthesis radical SAM protein ArsS [Rhodoferax sp.]
MHATLPLLQPTDFPALKRHNLDTLQVNLGYRCNQSCLHCHVSAGPHRAEMMDAATVALIPPVLQAQAISTLDLTGGAPELHPEFRALIRQARAAGVHVIDRCNLTVLLEPGQEGTAEFLARKQVEIVASLPCYSTGNVDQQRGEGTFEKSIVALRRLNALGYGRPGSGLALKLVYNPQGPVLPPSQAALQAAYQQELQLQFGIVFNELLVLANMPIQRFGSALISKGTFHTYLELLKRHHQNANLGQVMCRSLLSVDWQGYLYDCDFNQQLGLTVPGYAQSAQPLHMRDLLNTRLRHQPIRVANHCYGCTAGQGSSCAGALT